MTAPRNPLRYRNPVLVAAILDHIYQADQPVPWLELVDRHTSDGNPWRTVENVLYDLVIVGAAHRIGTPGTRTRPDTRALRPTTLGAAWLDQRLEPLPGSEPHQ